LRCFSETRKNRNKNKKTKIGELFLVLGTGLFVVGAIGYSWYLSQEQIPAIGALALIFVGAGASMKRRREMSNKETKHMSNLSFRILALIHDNPIRSVFCDPYKRLRVAGLKRGQKVLEVGCGPGFFTIPAAKIVGEEGAVYAADVHPLAIERVKGKNREGGDEER